jgi:cystathionine beta-lyase
MAVFDFDTIPQRRGTIAVKWEKYPADVLPMWVADTDFRSPEPVIRALHERVEHGFFGYGYDYVGSCGPLADVMCARLEALYGWQVEPEAIVPMPSLVSGIHVVCKAVGAPGDSVLMNTPVYPPFLSAPAAHQRVANPVQLALTRHEHTVEYAMDWDAFAAAFHERTRLFLLCSPHNPTGQVFSRTELLRMAELCLANDTVICSDEIHCDLLLGGASHTPIAALSPEIADRTITLMAPSKTFNLPGLKAGMAIITNPQLRKQVQLAGMGIVPQINMLGYAAAVAAYSDCEDWLAALRVYLTENRDLLVRTVVEQIPQLRTTVPDATYLGWLDCRDAGIPGDPYTFFLNEAKVALSSGSGSSMPNFGFGPGGEDFVRINFGCPRAMLAEALERMRAALGSIEGVGA